MSDVELRGLVTDDDAVSSVLGVVLMVAITIVLAAAIGVFVLGIGTGLTDTTPQTRFTMSSEVSSSPTWVNVSVEGGDGFESENVYVTVDGTKAWDGESGYGGGFQSGASEWNDEVAAGDELSIVEDGSSISSGDEVQVVWTGSDGRTAILFEETA